MAKSDYQLLLLSSNFPYGAGESFIDYELPYLKAYFRKIVILASNSRDALQRTMDPEIGIYRHRTQEGIRGWLRMPIFILAYLGTIRMLYRDEMQFRKQIMQKLSWKQRYWILKRSIKAIALKNKIRQVLKKEEMDHQVVLYSYWFNTAAHAISLLKLPGSIRMARSHGSDLYEYMHPMKLHPMHKRLAMELDALFFISRFGKDYFEELIQSRQEKHKLSRLGIDLPEKQGDEDLSGKDLSGTLVVVSCAALKKVKRIHLIVESLSKTRTGKKIHWIHFGDGPLMQEIRLMAAEKLDPLGHISYTFKGQVENKSLHQFYQNNKIDLILNVSHSEGIPVSIMEAQAYGIPAIATRVGGSAEIVTEKTGILLQKDFLPEEFLTALDHFIRLDESTRARYRDDCIRNWQENFNARVNFPAFIQQIDQLIKTKSTHAN